MKSKLLVGVIALVVMLSLWQYHLLSRKYHNLYTDSITINNELAKQSVLVRDLKTGIQSKLSEKNQEINSLLSENDNLKLYVKKNKEQIKALASNVQTLTLENLSMKSRLTVSDSGILSAPFDTANAHFSINGRTNIDLKDSTSETVINKLKFSDSLRVGFTETEAGMIKGVISHTNPYITDGNTTFNWQYTPKDNCEGTSPTVYALFVSLGVVLGLVF